MVGIHIGHNAKFILGSLSLHGSHPHFFDDRSTVGIFLLDVFHLGAHGGDHMNFALQHGVNHVALQRRYIVPGRVTIARLATLGRILDQFKRTTRPLPGMG